MTHCLESRPVMVGVSRRGVDNESRDLLRYPVRGLISDKLFSFKFREDARSAKLLGIDIGHALIRIEGCKTPRERMYNSETQIVEDDGTKASA